MTRFSSAALTSARLSRTKFKSSICGSPRECVINQAACACLHCVRAANWRAQHRNKVTRTKFKVQKHATDAKDSQGSLSRGRTGYALSTGNQSLSKGNVAAGRQAA